jgi:hypothetical protein
VTLKQSGDYVQLGLTGYTKDSPNITVFLMYTDRNSVV